jgi:hypothetical protein
VLRLRLDNKRTKDSYPGVEARWEWGSRPLSKLKKRRALESLLEYILTGSTPYIIYAPSDPSTTNSLLITPE